MNYYDCTVCLNKCSGGYSFQSCLQKYCSQYYYYYSGGKRKSKCVGYSYYSHSESACIATCCGDVGIGKNVMDDAMLGTCVGENKRMISQLGIILGSVFGGIALLIIGIIGFVWWKRRA